MSLPLPSNLLLDSLTAEARAAAIAHCEHIKMPLRYELFNSDQQPRYVHFLTSGIAAVVTMMQGGEAVEVGLTGREGLEKYQLLGPRLERPHASCNSPGRGSG